MSNTTIQAQQNILLRAIENAEQWVVGPARGTFPAPDKGLLQAARRTIGKAGREAMRAFLDWLIEEEGMVPGSAQVYAAHVWQAVLSTGGNPVHQIRRMDLTFATKNTIRAALKRFAVYAQDAELASAVASNKVTRLLKDRRNSAPQKTVYPLAQDMLDQLVGAVNADKGNPRRPWAWPCISMLIKLGLRARSDLALGITRQAVLDGVAGKPLVIVGKRGTRRVVPSSVVKEELEVLAAFPFEWNLLCDLIAPAAVPESRGESAYGKLRATLKEYARDAGIDPKEIHTHRLRHTAALKLYEASGHDIMLVAHFLGHASVETTRRYLEKDRTADIEKHLNALAARSTQ